MTPTQLAIVNVSLGFIMGAYISWLITNFYWEKERKKTFKERFGDGFEVILS